MEDDCTVWPQAFADVAPDEMEDFLEHAAQCPLHERVLREEDARIRSIFRLARGFDSDGRILHGEELEQAVADHKRCAQTWETVGSRESPFERISLYNGRRLIIGCGDVHDLTWHEASYELDPRAGLQIRARCGGGNDEEVLLGFYPLAGVRHDGRERTLKLPNGYTLALRVNKRGGRKFQVNFRCVESSIIEREAAEACVRPRTRARRALANRASYGDSHGPSRVPLEQGQGGCLRAFRGPRGGAWRATLLAAALCLAPLFGTAPSHRPPSHTGSVVPTPSLKEAQGGSTEERAGTNDPPSATEARNARLLCRGRCGTRRGASSRPSVMAATVPLTLASAPQGAERPSPARGPFVSSDEELLSDIKSEMLGLRKQDGGAPDVRNPSPQGEALPDTVPVPPRDHVPQPELGIRNECYHYKNDQ